MSTLPIPMLEELKHILSGEIEDYRQLLFLTQHERAALQSGSLIELMATTQDKTHLLQQLTESSRSRQQIGTKLAETAKLPSEASLADLLPFCDETIGQTLNSLRQEFITLAQQLHSLNQENRLLLQTELARINATVNYLLPDISLSAGYSVQGAAAPSSPAPAAGNVLDCHI